jgi:1-deoxy-D-xylulose-5-phosphate synthase
MLFTAFRHDGPSAVRYPRGKGPGVAIEQSMQAIPIGTATTVRSGQDIALLAFGSMVTPCTGVAERLGATLINMRFVKPLDRDAIVKAAETHGILITVEENAVAGGAGSGVGELLATENIQVRIKHIGLTDDFIQHGTRDECLQQAGLDETGILRQVEKLIESSKPLSQSTHF